MSQPAKIIEELSAESTSQKHDECLPTEPASCIWPAGNQSTSYPVAFALVEKASKSGCWLKSGTRATFNAVEC
ncbi:hypothetical protein ABFA07_011122 [Porites harrisoni]